MPCEFFSYHRVAGILVELCVLTGRRCFVEQPESTEGRILQHSCTRRVWALETEPYEKMMTKPSHKPSFDKKTSTERAP